MPMLALLALALSLVTLVRLAAASLPDGGQLVFSATLDTPTSLYLFDITHHLLSRLTRGAVSTGAASWSGDHSKIVYVANFAGATTNEAIVYQDLANSRGAALFPREPVHGSVLALPVWSPDDQQIVFTYYATIGAYPTVPELVRIRIPDGITTLAVFPDAQRHNHALYWLDNHRVRYVEVSAHQVRVKDIDLDDFSGQVIASWQVNFNRWWDPVIAPDGNRIVVPAMINREEAFDLFTFDIATGAMADITPGSATNETLPAWSSDGTLIAYKRLGDFGRRCDRRPC